MNKAILIGNLTRDPEMSTTSNGIAVCKFSIAVNRKFKNASGETEVDYLNIVTWRGLAENCSKYLTKGNKVAVSGSIQTRTYEVEGQKRYATDIQADDIQFLTPKNNSDGVKKTADELTPVGDDEGLPF